MTTDKTGGPAYPCEEITGAYVHNANTGHIHHETVKKSGITLLDRYAIEAMGCVMWNDKSRSDDETAKIVFDIAAAMLRARERYINGEPNQ